MKTTLKFRLILSFILPLAFFSTLFAQSELVSVNHKVYQFFNQLHKEKLIKNYNSANLPLSRGAVADMLKELDKRFDLLSKTEKKIFSDLKIEFSYELNGNLEDSYSLFTEPRFASIVDDDKQKYLYSFADSNATLFLDATAFIGYRKYSAQSFNSTQIGLGEFGFRMRGTLYDNIGYYLRASTGQQVNGDLYSRRTAARFDPKLHSSFKFIGEKYFETYEGYLRYESSNRNVALTFGREAINFGTGYIDKMMISNNAVPFDYGKVDLGYKGIKYSFFYGNLRGDSLGVVLESKNFISHRFDFSFSDDIRFGIYEAVLTADRPISFTYLNPLSFLFSADLAAQKDNTSNSLMGFDLEVLPFKNIGLQATFIIDDYDFKLIGKDTPESNNNRFGWQFGMFYANTFGIENLNTAIEFTHLDPFFYSHKSNKTQYTHWSLPLGHKLNPNSDEIAVKFDYWFSSRIRTSIKYQMQRTGEGLVYDQNKNLIRNYGADINHGEGLYLAKAIFLEGNRTNTNILTFNLLIEPIRQYFIDITYTGWFLDKKFASKNYTDHFLYVTISTDF